ncbi:glycosyl hydrolase family 8 [Tenacibaculum sp. M341]|uniref:glycosyl hydrolase family 8 n=1 Tax=Tenacibaculum sp. M341 TaxID=2530339 RepID=UPI001044A3EC|nr:glycosyl hydrolase family 8 [Tenacibaculum sp. M341]TCI91354.1 T9SS type A sorting domain-containing protein [Tenacibaculum sp. M341]
MKTLITLVTLLLHLSMFAQYTFESKAYDHGILPSNFQNSDLEAAYTDWKSRFADTNCTNGRARVKFDDPNFTVSEGIAYGMLLSVYADDQALFDGLWKYYQSHTNANGVMHWKIQGCDTVNGQNGATDAELDVAVSLITAGYRFGNTGAINYHQDARDLIAIMKQHEVEANTYVLKPGDAWGGSNNTNPSYLAPGYFRLYGEFTGDTQFWNNVADKSYEILNANLSVNNAKECLVSDWCKADGSYSDIVGWAFNSGKSYYYDAARTPWRIATDYVWYGNADALDYMKKCENFINEVGGIDQITAGYHQDGTVILGNSGTTYKDVVFTGAFASALLTVGNQSTVDFAYTTTKSQTSTGYFANTLRALYMFTMTGNLFKPTGTSLSTSDVVPSKEKEIIVYPNPSTEKLHVTNFKLGSKVKVYNLLGKQVMETSVKDENVDVIDVSDLTAGIYFIRSNNVKLRFVKE